MSITLLCGTLIDGTGREPIGHAVLRVEDERITATDAARPGSPGATRVIDLRRWTVLPGLIDAHDHLCFDWTDPKDLLSREPDTWSILRGRRELPAHPPRRNYRAPRLYRHEM
jgi:imidazolonepropionase-like amidohydrolase